MSALLASAADGGAVTQAINEKDAKDNLDGAAGLEAALRKRLIEVHAANSGEETKSIVSGKDNGFEDNLTWNE
ncbi:unnamed protein product [Darwinula stevensoni]|uniref:Uncharacterized protein n=1 Tax=Darwinula stevensoni TaxID=69355 RepID=A0A7R9A979_9CRUS|nr:unnamed protein product [Darwinula stevensoni]CAG0897115.1 unnamed protein product [Darwinula stevensoni]